MSVPRYNYRQIARIARRYTERFVERVEHDGALPMREVFANHPKLVLVMAHGHAFSWVPLFRLVELIVENGGGERTFIGAAHKFFYLPVIRRFGVRMTQVESALSFEEFVERFRTDDYNDFMVMPEGDHCLWGNGVDIVPFTSPRFIEIALRVGAPLLLMVHRGTEPWARTWTISEERIPLIRLLPQRMREVIASTRSFTFTVRTPKLPVLQVRVALYHPTIRLDELSTDPTERRDQLWEEAERVRSTMQAMVDQLHRPSGAPRPA